LIDTLEEMFLQFRKMSLGGHLKTGHTWTLQNRPTKSRNSGQDLLYLGMLNSANIFCLDGHF
jgi:hypothetical protein